MREIKIKMNIGVQGFASLILKSGTIRKQNTVTNKGLSEICCAMLDKSMPWYYFAIGIDDSNSTADEIALQNQLKAEIQRAYFDKRKVTQDLDLNYKFVAEAQFSQNTAGYVNGLTSLIGQEIKEVGLFNRYTEGEMIARVQKFPSLTMDNDSILGGIWEIKINVQDIFTSGGIVRKGSELVCKSMMKFDSLIDNQNQYYDHDNEAQDYQFTPHPWGINTVSLGTGTNSTTLDTTELNTPMTDYDAPPTITRLDLTGESSDVNYNPKVIIQRYIPLNKIPFIIKEAGLFNVRNARLISNSGVKTNLRTMFSRVVLPAPIPANTEAVLTWEINFKRGA